ncbi:transcriptional regulator [Methanococcus maripaludis C5]|uniref:Transcriptional regulator n=1 Tax=Methanococcus maripaludis (strain C5 / ATCC BAA-1333) TaxID=402880 RepID=A4FZF0_METM5|nr:helix-turn-helix transcriptional regulator [Methanococcus maripaludis]ABO35584.1 transcriptional regulator [Methanococcus maripaludis C5]
MLINLLSKKHVREIMTFLNESGEVHYSMIQKSLKINKGTLSSLLLLLMEHELVDKRKDETDGDEGLIKTYYYLTEHGKTVMSLFEVEKALENRDKKKLDNLTTYIIGNNNQNIGNINVNNNFMSNNSFQK